MAIRMMTSESKVGQPNVEVVDNYPGHETGQVYHADNCPHKGKYDKSGQFSPECVTDWESAKGCPCRIMGPLYMETTHEGVVLELGEYNGRDDSDFYAVVWDTAEGKPKRVEYASTRGWTYPNNAWVDATPEVMAAYQKYCRDQQERARKANQLKLAMTPRKGKTLKVVKGRKVPLGTVGRCIWVGPDKYKSNGTRVGLQDEKGTVHWTDATNVEVQLPEGWESDSLYR